MFLFGTFLWAKNLHAATSFFVIPADDPGCSVNGDGTVNQCASGPGQPGYWKGFSNIQWGSGVNQLGGDKTLNLIGGKTYKENLVFPEIGSGQDEIHPLKVTVFGQGAAVLDLELIPNKSGIIFGYGALHDIVIDGVRGDAVVGDYNYGIKIVNVAEDPDHQCCYGVLQNTSGNKNIKVLHLDISSPVHTCREATGDPGNYGWHENPLAAIRMIDTSLGENINLEIAYNWIHGTDCTDRSTYWITSGIRAGWGGATTGYTNTKIHHNLIECIGADGITGVSHGSVYNNIVRNSGTSVGTCATSVHADALEGGEAHSFLLYNNYFSTIGQNIYLPKDFVGTSTDIWVFNNVSVGGKSFSIGGNGGVNTNLKVFNNTFSSGVFAAGFCADHPPTGLDIRNNIFGDSGDRVVLWLCSNYANQIINMDYNAYFSGSPHFPYVLSADKEYTLSDWKAKGFEAYGQTAIPSFNADYSLAAANPLLINRGTDLTSFCSDVQWLCYDKNGVSRPQGSAWDIGAYEYVGGAPPDTTPPSTPSGLKVI